VFLPVGARQIQERVFLCDLYFMSLLSPLSLGTLPSRATL
jgi:hypothetical protein